MAKKQKKKPSDGMDQFEEDIELFARMQGNYQSENEENFFRNLEYKQKYEVTACNDLLVWEKENDDLIYFVREEYHEYLVVHGYDEDDWEEEHVMKLADALAVNLKPLGFERDITLWQWLKETDYKYVKYNRNYDKVYYDGERKTFLPW